MTIQQEIVAWAASRPGWQQTALCRLVAGEQWDDAELKALLQDIKAGASGGQVLTEAAIPVATSTVATVSLRAIRDLKNVNALVPAQDLNFAESGLTVVYGDNASGKSGYARLIKSAVRSLHHEPVHGNVFASQPDAEQHAEILYRSGTEDDTTAWPSQSPGDLNAISFYDEACGDAYVEKESELGYRPSALVLLDGLIDLCDRVAAELELELQQNAAEFTGLPDPPEGTPAADFIGGLSGKTTQAELDAACALDPDADADLANQRQEEARLMASNPAEEIKRLRGFAQEMRSLATRAGRLLGQLDDEAAAGVVARKDAARSAREAAALASSTDFGGEPLNGVGGDAWRNLWEAARDYSVADAYPGMEFPVTEDANCVLCQQPLSEDAANRLRRFETFVGDSTARKAEEAEAALREATRALSELEAEPPTLGAARASLRGKDEAFAGELEEWLEDAETRRAALLASLSDASSVELPELGASPKERLDGLADAADAEAALIDEEQFKATLEGVVKKKKEIEGRKALAAQKEELEGEITRQAAREEIEAAKRETNTKGITRKTTELTEKYVTEEVRDRFTRESERLRLERIRLASTGGHKGRLRQRPELLGAKSSQPVRDVLSEGEQTALGLAGYFTEAFFDPSRSALVLDDPVSSLDHFRRRDVAQRLVELAADRQVVVFTHDLEFVVALSASAVRETVAFTERSVERRGQDPGVCVDEHPWKAKDVGRRLNELEQLLAEIKKERENWSQPQCEQKCAEWAGKLSETWERILHLEIAQPIFDLNSSEVHPKMLKVLARITEEDEQQFQDSYGKASEWARRHDKSPSLNYVPPEPEELEKELEGIGEFAKRVKGYKA